MVGDSSGEQDAGRGRLRRPLLWHAVFVLALCAGVYAAWRVHKQLDLGGDSGRRQAAQDPSVPTRAPFSRLELQGPGAGFAPLESDPAGLAPPPGAQRIWSGQDRQQGVHRRTARYKPSSPAREVLSHYRRLLGQAGYRLVLTSQEPDAPRRLAWRKGSDLVVLSLPRASQEATIVEHYLLTVWTAPALPEP
jgi:hypothetical protein